MTHFQNASVKPSWRVFVSLFLGSLLGGFGRKALYRLLCGYEIHPSAHIGFAFINVATAKFEPDSRIGHFTVVRNLELLQLAEGARIGTFNWIFGMLPSDVYFTSELSRKSALLIDRHASITSRHIVDCTNTVRLGEFSIVAGYYTQILTHGISISTNQQTSAAVEIGAHCMIGTRCVILMGAKIGERTVLGAGSVFRDRANNAGGLWSGVPAVRVSDVADDGLYFSRTEGHVS